MNSGNREEEPHQHPSVVNMLSVKVTFREGSISQHSSQG